MSIKEKYEDFLKEVQIVSKIAQENMASKEIFDKGDFEELLTTSTAYATILGSEDIFREAIEVLDTYAEGYI